LFSVYFDRRLMRYLVAAGWACWLMMLLSMPCARGQQLEPRVYSNAPVGMNFLIGGYAYSTGGLSTNPALNITNAQLKVETPVLAYARALDAWGRSAKFDVIVPGGCLSGSADVNGAQQTRDVCGLLDPAFRFSVNFYGAPALSLKDFAAYRQDLVAGASLQVSAPWGQYDPSRLVNLGTNRWTFRPEIGVSKAAGPLTLEASLGASLYTTNHDFFGGKILEQDPMFSTQGHVIYQFRNGAWAALNVTYYFGGRTTVNGVPGTDRQSASRAGATLTLPVDRLNSVKLFASTGVSVRTGSDFDILGVAWQYRWGGGL
jgi:hypothetical protein